MEQQGSNKYVVRSVWRRLKKGRLVKVSRDLKPIEDVKGGGGLTGKCKPNTGSTDTAGNE